MTRTAVGIDIGGTGIKGAIVDVASGTLISDRIKLATPDRGRPDDIVDTVLEIGGGDGAHTLAFSAAALPARRPNTQHSRRELPIMRLRPCVPPAISPHA